MSVANVYNIKKEKISETELMDNVFGIPIKKHMLHQVVISQLNKRRTGTAATKSRSQIKASNRKLWRQKGTGRARVGSSSSPTRKGGGVAFGPSPRDYQYKVPRKIKKAALCMALTDKVQSNRLIVIDAFSLPEIKTKTFVEVMDLFAVNNALIVTENKKENLEKSSKNVPWIKVLRYEGLNVYDILKYDYLFLEQSTIGKIEEDIV